MVSSLLSMSADLVAAPKLSESSKMNLVLKKLKIKVSWEAILEEFESYEEFDQDFFDSKHFKVIFKQYQDVFYFGAVKTDKAMLNNLKKWFSKYWSDFTADTNDDILRLMQNALKSWNDRNPEEPKNFDKELPKYGRKSAAEFKEKQAAIIAKLTEEKPPKTK
jgi:gas vesicle protein